MTVGTRILLVEDNEMNRDMLSRRLTRKGFTVEVSVDGAEAVAKALSSSPDIVLMDMNLPIKDGWTASREIRDNPTTSHVPIIALTAHAMSDDRARAIEAGCNDYETKPLDFARLLDKIAALTQPNG
jgi:two-component system response regulator